MQTNGYMMVFILVMTWKVQMLKRIECLTRLIFVLVLSVASLASANEDTESPVEQLVQDFIVAFNTGNPDTMARYYQHAASTSFNKRRTEKEGRDLYQVLVDKFGTLSYRPRPSMAPPQTARHHRPSSRPLARRHPS